MYKKNKKETMKEVKLRIGSSFIIQELPKDITTKKTINVIVTVTVDSNVGLSSERIIIKLRTYILTYYVGVKGIPVVEYYKNTTKRFEFRLVSSGGFAGKSTTNRSCQISRNVFLCFQ